jgi:hypothetical protein
MSGKFFSKTRIDADEIARIASDLDDLASSADSFRDELDSYKDELYSAKGDLEDAETAEDVAEVISRLRDISVPEGYDNPDGTPDNVADELDGLESDRSEYDEWQESVQDEINTVLANLDHIGRGWLLPSQKVHNYTLLVEKDAAARILRPGQEKNDKSNLPFSGETDAWAKALNALADKASRVHYGPEAEFTRDGYSKGVVDDLLKAVTSIMAFKHASGAVISPTDQPMLALMWFVDDLLQAVARHMHGMSEARVVVTNTFALSQLRRTVDHTRARFSEGCEKIDESVNANS